MEKNLNILIYLSPLPWTSFEQRPHKFARWFHRRTGGKVLWIDPYPTRLPKLADFKRLLHVYSEDSKTDIPSWLEVIRPASLPIEPLDGSEKINKLIWRNTLKRAFSVADSCHTLVVIGKPSALADQILEGFSKSLSVYDVMDDFPAFYDGVSKKAMLSMLKWEKNIADKVSKIIVSSTPLLKRWSAIRKDTQLIYNGLDVELLPNVEMAPVRTHSFTRFGYIGTLGSWFDWEWLIKLAEMKPDDQFVLIGPLLSSCPFKLPNNIFLKPACEHQKALKHMMSFDVGLIPFRRNKLTNSVDPIKYYEYRAMGIPVLSTAFGEMSFRTEEPGTFIVVNDKHLESLADQAACWTFTKEDIERFTIKNSWDARFDQLEIL